MNVSVLVNHKKLFDISLAIYVLSMYLKILMNNFFAIWRQMKGYSFHLDIIKDALHHQDD